MGVFGAATLAAAILALLPQPARAQVPPVVIEAPESHLPADATTTYAGTCGGRPAAVEVDTTDHVAPRVTVRLGDRSRAFDATEPFVHDLFFGRRYDLVQLICHDGGLRLLSLMLVSRDGAPVWLVGAVYFDTTLAITRYDGLGVDTDGGLDLLDQDFYERELRERPGSAAVGGERGTP